MRLKPSILLGRPDQPSTLNTFIHACNLWLHGCLLLTWLSAFQYFSYSHQRDPTSAFFTPAQGYERRYSLQREREGNAFIDAVKDSTSVRAPPKNPLMCLGITTVQRDGHQYIRPAIGSLLDGLEKTQRDQVHLMVFIAQTDPKSHPAYDQGWLRAVSNEILEYDVDDVELARLRSLEEEHLYWNKSGYDYAYILDKCAATGASWVVIVEDDTVAAKGWYPRALEALNAISKSQSDWIYLCMFYTEKLLGWNSESWVFYLAISISLFCWFHRPIMGIILRISTFPQICHKSGSIRPLLVLVPSRCHIILYGW